MNEQLESKAASSSEEALARVDQLSVGFESDVVLREVSCEIPNHGILGVLGPAGVGKSTLLRTLGRWNDARPSFWSHGHVWLEGRDLLREVEVDEARRRFALLSQKARLYTATILDNVIADVELERPLRLSDKRKLARDILSPLGLWRELERVLDEEVVSLPIATQRKVSLARLVAGGASCILADEPLRDISESEAEDLGEFLRSLGRKLAIIMVTHNQKEARDLCDDVCLLTAGRLVEAAPAREFFDQPRTELGTQFLALGNCWPSPEGSAVDEAKEPIAPSWKPEEEETIPRPGAFHWVIDGLLGGMQQPGLMRDLATDLKALRQLGCKRLVTLTEEGFPQERLDEFGIDVTHFPIADMGVPALDEARTACEKISSWVDDGVPTVLHCRAGLGRTGTMLACALVYRGENVVRAIERVRVINPYYIQSPEQLAFVDTFWRHLASLRNECP